MNTFLPKALDQFFQRHPYGMFACVIILAVAATFALLATGQNRLVYEGF